MVYSIFPILILLSIQTPCHCQHQIGFDCYCYHHKPEPPTREIRERRASFFRRVFGMSQLLLPSFQLAYSLYRVAYLQ